MRSTSIADKAAVGIAGALGFAWSLWATFWLLPVLLLKLFVVCVVPAVIVIPARLLCGGSALPPRGERVAAFFGAFLLGYMGVMAAFFVLGCFITPVGLLESLTSTKLMPEWVAPTLHDLLWPIAGSGFVGGVWYAAILGVREEKQQEIQATGG
jgi:hypothetical protein